jgi:ABC-2 type transport system ATP-binding protein
MNILRFDGVYKSFAGKRVLDNLCFSVNEGKVYGLLGPNGSGKSTAINILCNLLDPDSGTVEIKGMPPSAETNRLIGVCPQENALYRDLRPAENLRFFTRLYGLPNKAQIARVKELTELFGFGPFSHTSVGALSGGWQRRVNIAAALIHRPEILVLDEPTAAVDLEARLELWQMINTLKKEVSALLLTTHHLDEAEQLCSRIGIIKNGHIIKEGTVDELLALVPATAIALLETHDENSVRERAASLGWGTRNYAGRIGCLLPQQASLKEVVDAFGGLDVSSVSLQRVSLEHAYLEIMQQSE